MKIIYSYFKYSFIAFIIISAFRCTPITKEMPASNGPNIRVHLATVSARDSLEFSGSYFLKSEEARFELGERNKKIYFHPLKNGINLYNNFRNLVYRNDFPVVLIPGKAGNTFTYHGSSYRGKILFFAAGDSSLYLVNELPIEEYLQGVVPAEIPANDAGYFEADKAQAVCARTYAYMRLGSNNDRPFDVYSSVLDQVYAGIERHEDLSDKAVQETRGVVLTFNNQPVTVYYHSTCGGRLEAVENVWANSKVPFQFTAIDAVGDFFSCSASPRFRWIETLSFAQVDTLFELYTKKSLLADAMQSQNIDTLKLNLNLEITSRTNSGRVRELKVNYADSSLTISGTDIRRFLAWPPGGYLRSNLFFFEQPDDSTLEIHGAGYGHGVGMCQWGAMNMSQRGFKYYHILSKYYPGTVLKRIY